MRYDKIGDSPWRKLNQACLQSWWSWENIPDCRSAIMFSGKNWTIVMSSYFQLASRHLSTKSSGNVPTSIVWSALLQIDGKIHDFVPNLNEIHRIRNEISLIVRIQVTLLRKNELCVIYILLEKNTTSINGVLCREHARTGSLFVKNRLWFSLWIALKMATEPGWQGNL